MKSKLCFATAMTAASMIAGAGAAHAQTSTGTMPVSATVTENCVIAGQPLDFASVDVTSGAEVTGAGSVTVTCTQGVEYTLNADVAEGGDATARTMTSTSGTEVLSYALFTDAARTQAWGNGVSGQPLTGTGTGSEEAVSIYAKVAANQNALPADTYTDTVSMTITY